MASIDSLKAANDDSPPHWFNPERFVESNFDAEGYVADLRRYVRSLVSFKSMNILLLSFSVGCNTDESFTCSAIPLLASIQSTAVDRQSGVKSFDVLQVPLEALSAELEAHLQVLRNRLVEVINEHYGDFVSLSSKLVNVDSAVIRMQKPLLDIKVPHLPPSPPTLCPSSRPEPLFEPRLCI